MPVFYDGINEAVGNRETVQTLVELDGKPVGEDKHNLRRSESYTEMRIILIP